MSVAAAIRRCIVWGLLVSLSASCGQSHDDTFVDVRFDAIDGLKSSVTEITLSIESESGELVLGPIAEALSGEELPVSVRVERGSSDFFFVDVSLRDATGEIASLRTRVTHQANRRELLLILGETCLGVEACCDDEPCAADAALDGGDGAADAKRPDVFVPKGPAPLVETLNQYTDIEPLAACPTSCSRFVEGFALETPVQVSGSWLVLAQGEAAFSHPWHNTWTTLFVDGREYSRAGGPVQQEASTPRPPHWFLFKLLDATEAHNIQLKVRFNGPDTDDKSVVLHDVELVAIWLPDDPRIVHSVLRPGQDDVVVAGPNSDWTPVISASRLDGDVDHLVFASENGYHAGGGDIYECRSMRLRFAGRFVPNLHTTSDSLGGTNDSTTCVRGLSRGLNTFVTLQSKADSARADIEIRNFSNTNDSRAEAAELLLVPMDIFGAADRIASDATAQNILVTADTMPWSVSTTWVGQAAPGHNLVLGSFFLSNATDDFAIRTATFVVGDAQRDMRFKAGWYNAPHVFFHLYEGAEEQAVAFTAGSEGLDMRVSNAEVFGLNLP